MQWLALMFVGFMVLGLRRHNGRGVHALIVLLVAATLAIWYTRMH
jgi:hypothetical protein